MSSAAASSSSSSSSSKESKKQSDRKSAHDSDTEDEVDPSRTSSTPVPARFAGQSLYQVLGVAKDAQPDAIKKAYRRMALSVHPDLNKSPHATAEFQYLSRCHEVLSDATRRRTYDATGSMEDGSNSLSNESELDAYEYWRSIFPKITADDIENYRKKYEGSVEEEEDLLQAHSQYEGDLTLIFESVPFACYSSVDRLISVLKRILIEKSASKSITVKAVKELKKHLAETEEVEAEEAEEALRELSAKDQALMRVASQAKSKGASDESALALIFAQRAKEREAGGRAFLEQMEAKYATAQPSKNKKKSASSAAGGKKGKRKADAAEEEEENDADGDARMAEPSEDEFAAVQARMMASKKNQSSKASPAKKSKK